MKFSEVVVPTKNSVAYKKMAQKTINKSCGAMALILAFVSISNAYRPRIEKMRPHNPHSQYSGRKPYGSLKDKVPEDQS